ncbi:MAG: serine/threonine protein kinase/serine/threonine protein phosphatase PrpC [Alteromonadaceae bacterium]|jgi:serine/threonine protein kinase/serine/threonine protein phosphatase PrpC
MTTDNNTRHKQQDDLVISYGGYSSKGDKSENQDAFTLKKNQGLDLELKGHVAVIADGVSSANCAAKASQMSACHFINEYSATPETWSVKKSATKVISSLNQWLYAQQLVADEQGRLAQWFTTFTALILKGERGHIFHIGDCQVAKINDDGYQVLTKEHASLSGTLNRALGAGTHIEIDMVTTPLAQHDTLMLSCDGVHHFVKSKQIQQLLTAHHNLEEASLSITQLAKAQGSPDNLTCLLIKIEQLPTQAFSQLVFNRIQQVIPPALRIGSKLDHYEILDTLQETSRSHVYLAKHTLTKNNHVNETDEEQLVVIKTPSLNFSENEAYLTGFIKEGWIGHKITHPAMMKIYDSVPNGRFLYHACEYIEGQNLAAWSKDNPLADLIKVRDITSQLVKALRVLQRHEIVHCDIKPDNFIIDSQGRIKLIDFGSSTIGSVDDGSVDSASDKEAALGLGTLNYSAPELFYGQENSHKSELFSLAVLTYQLLTNRLPYKELNQVNAAPKQYNLWRYQALTNYRKDLPSYIDIVLAKALSADPNQRYDHYSEFISAFNRSDLSIQTPASLPLIDREPVKFWQGVSAVLLTLLLAVLFNS